MIIENDVACEMSLVDVAGLSRSCYERGELLICMVGALDVPQYVIEHSDIAIACNMDGTHCVIK